ncbi:hypothetical protein N0V91_008997 [Didymella pomorum]|uniref:Mid2 domain-containing protein n=1 Tax=Didymella pomorum TaxID=749634 RepID=A0A9W8Z7W3_9PLEO|nr:hypothetical protein N0V91_008997 [Didymella pomorum]
MFPKLTILFVLSTIPAFAAGSCYSRNGTLITDIAYQPCSSTGESACCGTNHDGAGHLNVANDVCDSNGLCQNYEAFDGTNEGVKLWWRQGCTDPTWSSPNCLASVCDTEDYEYENAPVYSCGNGNWACGSKSYCSTTSKLFTLAATVGKEVATSTSTFSVATASSRIDSNTLSGLPSISAPPSLTSFTTAASATATSTPPVSAPASQPLLSTAAKAGIGAGIAVLILLLSIILFLLHKIKKNRKVQEAYAKAELPGQSAPMGGKRQMTVYTHEASREAVEMPAREVGAYEMNGGKERMELETGERVNEIGLQRERAELAASPSLGVRGSHA